MSRPPPRRPRLFGISAVTWLGLFTAGCGVTLEDGYKPRSLDASPDARKAYYASPFTDQAAAGAKEGAGADSGFHSGRR